MTKIYNFRIVFPTTGREIRTDTPFIVSPIYFRTEILSFSGFIHGESESTCSGNVVMAGTAYIRGTTETIATAALGGILSGSALIRGTTETTCVGTRIPGGGPI